MRAAEAKRQRKELDRQRAKHLKMQARKTVKELRARLRAARVDKVAQIKSARHQCRAHTCLLGRRAKERKARLLEELKLVTIQERASAKNRCEQGKRRARDSALSKIEQAKHALQHERAYQADLKRIDANNRAARLGIVRASKVERRQESDGEVLANIPAELTPLWRKVGRRIKGNARKSRTEAFLEYAHEHPREVVEAHESGVDARIRELQRRMNEEEKTARRRRYTAAELAEVPF